MESVYVSLKTAAEVQAFIGKLTDLDGQFDFVYDHYILDARSLMGVLALERSSPLRLDIQSNSAHILESLAPFLSKPAEEETTEGKNVN